MTAAEISRIQPVGDGRIRVLLSPQQLLPLLVAFAKDRERSDWEEAGKAAEEQECPTEITKLLGRDHIDAEVDRICLGIAQTPEYAGFSIVLSETQVREILRNGGAPPLSEEEFSELLRFETADSYGIHAGSAGDDEDDEYLAEWNADPCPDCEGDGRGNHHLDCPRIDTEAQYGPPWTPAPGPVLEQAESQS